MTCHLRENGPIGYQLELFGRSPRAEAEVLLNSGLWWAWKSRTRGWANLTRHSLPAILADLPGGALMVGADEELPAQMTDELVQRWTRRFCRAERVPLAMAISVTPGQQIAYVQQHSPERVTALLDALHVDRNAAHRSAYARLGPASLESIVERL